MSQSRQKLWHGTLLALGSTALTLLLFFSGALTTLENISYDWRMKLSRAETVAPEDVAVIMIDEAALGAMDPLVGRWPWPRSVHADVIDFLALGKPRAIIFDILFSERNSPDDDGRLIEASAAAGNVIHAMQIYADGGRAHAPALPAAALAHGVDGDDNNANNNFTLPLAGLIEASAGLGVVTSAPDDDGIYRRSQLWHDYQTRRFAGLAVAPLRELALPQAKQSLVNFYGRMQSYSMSGVLASAQQLLDGEVDGLLIDPFEFENKIVFIGASAVGLEDLKATPLGANVPGVMIHAAMAANLLDGDLLQEAPVALSVVGVVVAALLVCLLMLRLAALALKIAAPLLCAVIYAAFCLLLFEHNQVMAMAPPLLAMMLAAAFCAAYLLFSEGRDKRRVRTMLAQYVSPAVLSKVVESYQDHLQAEIGMEEELSILFSDIRGFTNLSETLPAARVVELLNHYFSVMTETIFEQHGTIDKFIGDAIMAFWGAPVREPRHADLALRAAIDMQRRLAEVNQWLLGHDYPAIQIGIGINSGRVILGNIGSVQKLDYTVIGDNVNLASRLEGLTKQYGAAIVISEYSYEKLLQPPPCLILDLVRVKGKRVPIRIYAPVLDLDAAAAHEQEQLCRQAFEAYLNRAWQEAIELYARLPDGVLRDTFIERCRAYQTLPPPLEWDGVFTMKSK